MSGFFYRGLVTFMVLLIFSGSVSHDQEAKEPQPPTSLLVLTGEWFGDACFPLADDIASRGWIMKQLGADAEYRGCYNKSRDVVLHSKILIPDLKDFSGFDCLIIPGGPQFRKFNESPVALRFIRDAHSAGLLIAAFCIGNLVVKAAGLVDFPSGPALFPSKVTPVKPGFVK